jgi:hypothetical protein
VAVLGFCLIAGPAMSGAAPRIKTMSLKRSSGDGWRYALTMRTQRVSEAGNDFVGVDPIQTGGSLTKAFEYRRNRWRVTSSTKRGATIIRQLRDALEADPFVRVRAFALRRTQGFAGGSSTSAWFRIRGYNRTARPYKSHRVSDQD